MRPRLAFLLALPALLAVSARAAEAQSDQGLRDRIASELFTFGDCGQPLCLDLPNTPGNHFIPALAEGNDAVIAFLTDAIGDATVTVPLSATSSGATFSVVGGVPVRTSISAGPIFGERSQTLGRGRFLISTSVTGIDYTSLNGVTLQDLSLAFKHEDGAPAETLGDPSFENDVILLDLGMTVNVIVATVAATVGITDFIDIGVALPLVRTEVSGRSSAQVLPFGSTAIHRFGGTATDPVLRATATMEGSATGIGDVAVRAKINLGQSSSMGVALLGDVRLPTGAEEDLLGAGTTQFRIQGIPAVKAFRDGKVSTEFTGALPEPQVRAFFKKVAPTAAEKAARAAKDAVQGGDTAAAVAAYRKAKAAGNAELCGDREACWVFMGAWTKRYGAAEEKRIAHRACEALDQLARESRTEADGLRNKVAALKK